MSAASNVLSFLRPGLPGDNGDVHDDMVRIISSEANAANVGLKIQVHTGNSPV